MTGATGGPHRGGGGAMRGGGGATAARRPAAASAAAAGGRDHHAAGPASHHFYTTGTNSVFVRGTDATATREELTALFARFGTVAHLAANRAADGYVHVEMGSPEECRAVLAAGPLPLRHMTLVTVQGRPKPPRPVGASGGAATSGAQPRRGGGGTGPAAPATAAAAPQDQQQLGSAPSATTDGEERFVGPRGRRGRGADAETAGGDRLAAVGHASPALPRRAAAGPTAATGAGGGSTSAPAQQ